jgi:hypothetical protein
VTFTVFVEVFVLGHHTEFNLSSCSGSFVITVEKECWNILCYKRTYRYFSHLLTSWLYGPARREAPFTTEADYFYFTLRDVFFGEFFYFSNRPIYLQTTISSITLHGTNVALTLQLRVPSTLVLIFGGELKSAKAEVTSLLRQTMLSLHYRLRKKNLKLCTSKELQSGNKNISTVYW